MLFVDIQAAYYFSSACLLMYNFENIPALSTLKKQ